MCNKLSVAKILGNKAIFVSLCVVNTEKLDLGNVWLEPYQSVFHLSFMLYSDGSVVIHVDGSEYHEFASKAKATNWLKRKLKPITDKTPIMIHVLRRFDANLQNC